MLLLNSGHIKSHAHVKQNADWIVLYCAILIFVLLYFLVLASNMTWPYDVLIIWYLYGKFLDRESSYQYLFIFMDKVRGFEGGTISD